MSRRALKNSLGRRELMRAAFALGLVGCGGPKTVAAPVSRGFGSGGLSVWSVFDLPQEPRSRELSGLAWDAGTQSLYAVQDEASQIVVLRPDDLQLKAWHFTNAIKLDLKLQGNLDLEGIVVFPEGFVVASETGPRILEIDREGRLRAELRVPAHLADARANMSLESLALSPSGRFLVTSTEEALERDGPIASASNGTRVRILKMDRTGAEISEHAYETEPAATGGELGVSEITALSDDELLVLERGWAKGIGNSARIFRVDLAEEKASCLGEPKLAQGRHTLHKTLVVDIAKLNVGGLPKPKQPQASPLLDNFEGMTLGPKLPDGRPTLILVSDDNGRSDQTARLLVLTTA